MAVTLREFTKWFEELIPTACQEHYDNSGLQTGNPEDEISSVLLTLDVTPEVVSEAAGAGCNLIVSHHPLIFTPLKRVAYGNNTERSVAAAIMNRIAVYSAHTSFDNREGGVSFILAEKIGLEDISVLVPLKGMLNKLVTFVPKGYEEVVRDALFTAGAGHIGRYDRSSFNVLGEGTYRAGEGTKPFAGSQGKDHTEPEVRIEVILPSYMVDRCVRAMLAVHPYEEAAYDIIALGNEYRGAGAGAIGRFPSPVTGNELLAQLKKLTGIPSIRYSGDPSKMISTVAVCGGAGSGFIHDAARAGADAFITGDIKYHAFAEAPDNMIVADIGHYESEKFSLEILYDLIHKKFPNFALRFSGIKTNPINYYQ